MVPQLFRIAPLMPAQNYKTYVMARPLVSHWRPASCEEAGCDAYRYGWVSTFDLDTELGRQQYDYCKADKTRSVTIQRTSMSVVQFIYKPGNRCFRGSEHRLPIERPPRFLVAEGDWRGNPRQIPVRAYRDGGEWAGDFAEHQDRLATAIQRG